VGNFRKKQIDAKVKRAEINIVRGGDHTGTSRERERERERMELQIDRVHAKREGLATHYHESRV